MSRPVPALAVGLLAAAVVTGCSLLDGGADRAAEPRWDADVSMTAGGVELAEAARLAEKAPTYDITASIDPDSGEVQGSVRTSLAPGAEEELRYRFLPGLPDLDVDVSLGQVSVDGEQVGATLDAALVTVPLTADHDERVHVVVPFRYTVPTTEAGGGLLDALASLSGAGGQAAVGLLSRHEDTWNLGHWFPLWIPAGGSADPVPTGYGDIGSSPAALIRLELSVPAQWDVIDGGIRTHDEVTDGRRTIRSEGYGMNDLAVTLARGYVSEQRALEGDLAGVVVRAHAPQGSHDELAGVLDEAATSLEVLSDHFTAYPWRELDVVATHLGSGVAGMEWPGAVWIESDLFDGGVPGLGGLEEMLGDLQGPDGLLGGAGEGDTQRVLETLRPWTIAHEVGHEWWHVLVGNDSVRAPVVDEPLAQYSACLVMRELGQGTLPERDDLCRVHLDVGYEQMRMLGVTDARADQASDDFDSALQYSGVVYGKAAAFYLALEQQFGRDELTAALSALTEEHAFEMITATELREALAGGLGTGLTEAWIRWIEGTHGDADLS